MAAPVRVCLVCHREIDTTHGINVGRSILAAWRNGYCSPLHEQDDAVREATAGLAWWQRGGTPQ